MKLDSSRINLCCAENRHVIDLIEKKRLTNSMDSCRVIPLVLTDDLPLLEKPKFETIVESRNAIRNEIKKKEKFSK